MTEGGLVDAAVQIGAAVGGLGGTLFMVRWAVMWFTGRFDKRQELLDAESGTINEKWRAYRNTLEGRCARQDEKIDRMEVEIEKCHREKREMELHYDAEIEKCHEEKRALETRLVRLEAFADACGEMRQDAQIAESAQALIDRAEPPGD